MKAIQNELGEGEGRRLRDRGVSPEGSLSQALPDEVREKLNKEVGGQAALRLLRGHRPAQLSGRVPGAPWGKKTRERVSMEAAWKVLDEDHFGLEKVKERIWSSWR